MAKIEIPQKRIVLKVKEIIGNITPCFLNDNLFLSGCRNWLFQGMAMMHWKELWFRCVIESFFIFVVTSIIIIFSFYGPFLVVFIFSFFLVHTVFWIFNGHLWALHVGKKRLIQNKPEKIMNYLSGLEIRMQKRNGVSGCIIFGSFARGTFHKYSDLDIVLSPSDGFFNCIKTFLAAIEERAIAFGEKIPVEIYCYPIINFKEADYEETPVIVKDVEKKWRETLINYFLLSDISYKDMKFFKEEALLDKRKE